jgi:hypothetical protein
MGSAESSPFARHAKGGMLSAQLALFVYDVHHASIAMLAAESSPFARHAKGGLLSAQLARLAYDINHVNVAMLAAESSPFARHAKGGLRTTRLLPHLLSPKRNPEKSHLIVSVHDEIFRRGESKAWKKIHEVCMTIKHFQNTLLPAHVEAFEESTSCSTQVSLHLQSKSLSGNLSGHPRRSHILYFYAELIAGHCCRHCWVLFAESSSGCMLL